MVVPEVHRLLVLEDHVAAAPVQGCRPHQPLAHDPQRLQREAVLHQRELFVIQGVPGCAAAVGIARHRQAHGLLGDVGPHQVEQAFVLAIGMYFDLSAVRKGLGRRRQAGGHLGQFFLQIGNAKHPQAARRRLNQTDIPQPVEPDQPVVPTGMGVVHELVTQRAQHRIGTARVQVQKEQQIQMTRRGVWVPVMKLLPLG